MSASRAPPKTSKKRDGKRQERPKSAYELNAEKTFLEHLERLQNAQPSGPFMDPPLDLSFMNSKVSKNNSSERHGKVIMRENLQLLKRLALIQAESVEQRLKQQKLRNVGPPMHSVRYNVRMREKDEQARENLRLLRRLQTVESAYKREDFARDRRNFERLMNMRKQDNTRAHLFACHTGVGSHEKFKKMAEEDARREEENRTRPVRFVPKALREGADLLETPNKLPPLNAAKGKSAKKGRGKMPIVKKKKDSSEEGSTETGRKETVTLGNGGLGDGSSEYSNVAVTHCLMEIPTKCFVVAAPEGAKTIKCNIKVWANYPLSNQSILRFEVFESGTNRSIADTTCTVSEGKKMMATLEAVQSSETSKNDVADERELHQVYVILTQMFKEADEDGSGHLDRDEFFGLLRDAELGISEPELHMVLSEADEDDDGNIDYEEFLPIAIDLVQSFKARREAQREYNKQHGEVSEEALRLLYSGHVDDLIKKLDVALQATDIAKAGVLSRTDFKSCMRKNGMDLTKTEFNMVLARMPTDAFAKIKYKEIASVLYDVRFTTLKNSIMETRATDTEKLLMKLCQEQEESSMELADDMELKSVESLEPEYSGMITTMQLNRVLTNVKLSLNRLQVTSIMCEAEVDEGMIDYWTFVPIAAKAIDSMNDPNAIQQKADLMAQETISPEDFLKGKKESELRDELMEVFDQYDTDKSGELDTTEFEVCLQALDLGLTRGQIHALMAVADTDSTGLIDRDEFMEFGFQHLIHLQKERHVRAIQQSLELEESETKVTDEEMFHAYFDPDSNENSETMKAIERDLQRMFTKADKEGLGYLTPSAFRDVMTSMSLGMSPYQIAVLMTEADKNGDGIIQYSEFVPVGLRMLYSYKAKAAALRKYRVRESQAQVKSLNLMHAQQGQLDSCVHELELLFQSKDNSGGLVVLEQDVAEECLKDPRGGLTRQEIKLILNRMPREGRKLNCKGIRLVMGMVRQESVQRTVLLQMPSSTLEKHLLQLFSQETMKTRDMDEGVLTPEEIYEVMTNAKYLNLTRQQLMAVMSLTDHCVEQVPALGPDGLPITPKSPSRPGTPGNPGIPSDLIITRQTSESNTDYYVMDAEADVNYSKFASCAAEMISKFFDVTEIERRAKLLSGAKMSHVNIFGGLTKPELEKRLLVEFRDRDKRRTGVVNRILFTECMLSVKQLRLTEDDCLELMRVAPRDDAGNVRWRNWIEVASDMMMEQAEQKESRPSEAVTSQRAPGGKNANGISESMVCSVADKICNLLQLQSRPKDAEEGDLYNASFKDPSDSKNDFLGDEADIPIEPVSPSVRGIRRQLSRRASSEGPNSPTRASSAGDMGLNLDDDPLVLAYSNALYRTGRKVPVLGVSTFGKAPPEHHVVIEIKRTGEDQMADTASVIVLNVSLNERYVTTKALPSLAKVDYERAENWAKQVAWNVSLLQNYEDTRRIIFHKAIGSPPAALPAAENSTTKGHLAVAAR